MRTILNLSDLRVRYPQGDILKTQNLGKTVVEVVVQDRILGYYAVESVAPQKLIVKQVLANDGPPEALDAKMIVASLIKSLIGQLRMEPLTGDLTVTVVSGEANAEAYRAFGFELKTTGYVRTINAADAATLHQTKQILTRQTENLEKVGRGYVIDSQKATPRGLELLMKEYNEVAWGYGGWARHASIADDELKVIEDQKDSQASVVEIGAGSGRLTRVLAKKFKTVHATDYNRQIIQNLKDNLAAEGFTNIDTHHDDVTASALLEGAFDKVFYLENGLGGLLTLSERERAAKNMIKLLKPGGALILGVRSLGDSGDHLMPATQNPIFMGVYRTFSGGEIQQLIGTGAGVSEIIRGNERPAGGHQIFFIFKKAK